MDASILTVLTNGKMIVPARNEILYTKQFFEGPGDLISYRAYRGCLVYFFAVFSESVFIIPMSLRVLNNMLPRLLFGDKRSNINSDIDQYRSRFGALMRSVRRYEPLGNPADFRSKSACVKANDMVITAVAHTPLSIHIDALSNTSIIIPFHGFYAGCAEGREYVCQAREHALFLPPVTIMGECSLVSTLAIHVSEERLIETTRIMLGTHDDPSSILQLDRARVLPLRFGSIHFGSVLEKLCGVINDYREKGDLLTLHAVDDIFYRNIVVILSPGSFIKDSTGQCPRKVSNIHFDRVTEYIMANLHESITLTQLESISGLSARGLQHGFKKRFGCSPMQWIRKRRLELAHHQLQTANRDESVIQIALDCGFTRMGDFARTYYQTFGEYPSDTIRQGSYRV